MVDKDRQLLDCCLTDEQIRNTCKYDFKMLVKSKAKAQAFRTLMVVKNTKSKMDDIS